MRKLRTWLLWSLMICLAVSSLPLRAQADSGQELYALINQARLGSGLPPLGWSTRLSEAAQRHANDMATNRLIQSDGSDGSTYRQRIRDAGYRAWNEGLIVYETFWVGLGGATNTINWLQANAWSAFSDERYREVGIGYATDNQGVRYFVMNLGARPNVLPIFINDGAPTTDSPQVAVRLTNEETEPLGEGNWIGKAIEVRLSNTPQFEDEPWQPWSSLLPWELDGSQPGEYAVYAEFRDGAGRITQSQDTIRLVSSGQTEITPVAPGTAEPLVTPTETPEEHITPLPTPAPPDLPTLLPPEIITTPESVAPTPTPLPPVEIPPITPHPTWTPLPVALPVETQPVDWPLLMVFVLQGFALLLGMAAFLKRH